MENLNQNNSENSQILYIGSMSPNHTHIKFYLIWRSFSIVTKIEIKTCHNGSNSYYKGISGQINS
jgi:hypothetical protein